VALTLSWQEVAAGLGPGPRSRHCFWHDGAAGATVLFGGLVWHRGGAATYLGDTWELRGEEWWRVEGPGPAARHRAAAAFDPGRGAAVLFGGQGIGGDFHADTWLYAGGRWRRHRAWLRRGPAARCGHAMAYDPALGGVLLFGGIGAGDVPLGDAWLFDGRWRRLRATGPEPRRYAALAFDPDLGGCVLHGGAHDDAGRLTYGDAWRLRDGTWERLPGLATPPRDDHTLAYHGGTGRLLLFGGLSGQGALARSGERWEAVAVSGVAPPRYQCAPVAYDESLGGLVLYGGESGHGGSQFTLTRVLRAVSAI
jgi:hypothetical protein